MSKGSKQATQEMEGNQSFPHPQCLHLSMTVSPHEEINSPLLQLDAYFFPFVEEKTAKGGGKRSSVKKDNIVKIEKPLKSYVVSPSSCFGAASQPFSPLFYVGPSFLWDLQSNGQNRRFQD